MNSGIKVRKFGSAEGNGDTGWCDVPALAHKPGYEPFNEAEARLGRPIFAEIHDGRVDVDLHPVKLRRVRKIGPPGCLVFEPDGTIGCYRTIHADRLMELWHEDAPWTEAAVPGLIEEEPPWHPPESPIP